MTHIEAWRNVADARGFYQDASGWHAYSGVNVTAEFVRRVCTPERLAPVEHGTHPAEVTTAA